MLFSIDLQTLILFTASIFIIKGVFLLFIFSIRHHVFFKWLAYGCLSFALGWVLFFLRFTYGINLITLSVANILILFLPISLLFSILSFLKIRSSKLFLLAICSVLLFSFLFLTWSMHEKWTPGVYTSILHGIFYFVSGILLIKRAYPKQVIIYMMVWLNFLMALLLVVRSLILGIGWLYSGFIAESVITDLLTMALYFNIICIDAQILCFPILDFIEAQQSLTLANQKLEELSNIDELTGLLNRRALNTILDREIARCIIDNVPLSVILFDVDHFKHINDEYGHLIGDIVLEQIAKLIKYLVRPADLVMRYGGEEFIVVLLETDDAEAGAVAERLRIGVAQFHFHLPDIPSSLQATASFGVAGLSPDLSMRGLLKRADLALYKAKVQGRNQVCIG